MTLTFDDLIPKATNQPRGFRNMNPGNIEDGPFARSLPGYQGGDGRFARFDTMENGQGAIDRLLLSYGNRGFNTPNAIINRWAPPSDNNPTSAYAANVARALGVDPNATLDMRDPNVRRVIAEAIIRQENGQNLPANAAPVSMQPNARPVAQPMQLQGAAPDTVAPIQQVQSAPLPPPQAPVISFDDLIPARGPQAQPQSFDQIWQNDDGTQPNRAVGPATNPRTPLDPEIDRILAREAPTNRNARVEQHIRDDTPRALQAALQGNPLTAALATVLPSELIVQGMSYGFSEEALSYIKSALGQGVYDEVLEAQRERMRRTRADAPVSSAAAEVSGALLTSPIGGGNAAIQAATRGQRFVRGALNAGGLGALYGFGQGEGGLENRLTNAAVSGVVAAPIGGFVNAILPAVRPAVAQTQGSQVAEAAERLGVNLPRAVTSDNRVTQQVGKAITNVPIAGVPLRRASENAIGQLDEVAAATQRGYGNSNAATAGSIARQGLENYIGPVTSGRAKKLYDAVDNLVNPNTPTALVNTQKVAADIMARRSNAGIVQESDAVRRISNAVSRPNGLNYSGIKDLRSWIGETIDGGILPVDLSKAELKQIYGALTKDLQASVQNAGGQQAFSAWQRANKYYELVSKRRENLNRILGAKNDEGVFDRILSAAGSTARADHALLSQARKALPADEWNEIASAVIARMGRDPTFVTTPGSTVTAGGFSPDRFMTAYGKLSPAGKALLFRSTGQSALASALDDIATVSQRFKQLNTFANPSGTGQQLTSVIGGAGLIASPMTTIGTIIPAAVMSKLLARPQSARSIAKWSNAYYNAVARPTRASLQSFQAATRAFADDVGRQLNAPQHAEALFRQLQGAVPIRAEQNQGQR